MNEADRAAFDMQLTIPEILERGGVITDVLEIGGVAKWVCRAPKSIDDLFPNHGYCTPETSAKADPTRAAHRDCGWVKI